MKKIWDLFSLVQTAVILLLAMVILSIIGTLLPQQAPSLYNSFYFIALQSLLGFSLFACSFNRL